VVICPNPEFSIAKGLAYAARIDHRLEAFNNDIQAYFDSGDIAEAIRESIQWLTVPLSSILSGRIVYDVVLKVLEDWKKGEIRTVDEMKKPIIDRTKILLTGLEDIPEIRPATNDWCKKLFARVQPQLDEICRKHDVDRATMSLSYVRSISGPEKVDILMESSLLNGITYAVTAALTASLCGGGGIALIGTGPIGILAGAAIGLVVAFFGKKYLNNAINKTDLPLFTRKLMAISFKNSLSSPRQRKTIEKALMDTMDTPEFIKSLETEVTISLEAQIMKMARSVEMPITQ